GAAHAVLRRLSQLRDQLQPRQGSREAVHRSDGRQRAAAAVERIRAPARVASSAVGPARAGRTAALMNRSGPTPSAELLAQFGEIDIYLFDQLLRGRFDRRSRVLDAGCGEGRNLVFLLRFGFTCFGVDRDPAAVRVVRSLARDLAPALPAENFQAGELDRLPWDTGSMDAVICSAVLHFAAD